MSPRQLNETHWKQVELVVRGTPRNRELESSGSKVHQARAQFRSNAVKCARTRCTLSPPSYNQQVKGRSRAFTCELIHQDSFFGGPIFYWTTGESLGIGPDSKYDAVSFDL